MKKKMPYVLAGILLMISLVCMACGSTQEATALPDDANESIQDEEDEDLENDPNDGLGGDLNEDTVNDFSGFEGIWLGDANNDYDYMEFDSEGNWTLYLSGEVMDEGYLRYEPEWEAIYAYSNRDDSGSRIAMEEGQLYSAAYGYFNPGEGMEYLWYKDGGEFTEDDKPVAYVENGSGGSGNQNAHPDSYWSWDSDLCQRNVSEFEGVWYYDGDLSAEMYVVIDGNGDWSYYQRTPGAEAAEMDHGIFTYSTDETSTYYADSTVYDGVSYKVFDFDSDMLIWGDEGAYYRIRDLHFDAICYIPESAISTAANGTVVVSSELYDAYTGMWLTAGSTFNNSSRGDNYYLHTVSWRGNSYLIEFTYSTDWNFQVGDWGAVLTKSYSVYMPADYDGLVFAAQAEPDTYQESARKMQLDSISPEACVLDLDTLEPYSSLYFSLCD